MSVPSKRNLPARPSHAIPGKPRARYTSSASPRDVHRPVQPNERLRATTLAGPPVTLPQIRTNATGPSIEEMKQGMLHGVEKNVNQFAAINRQTQELSNTWAEHAAKFKVLPSSSPQVDATNPVARPASKFLNAEDYAFFSLISIINTHLHNNIFKPFHPAASSQQNSMFQQGYQKQTRTALQIIVASWRSRTFGAVEASVNGAQKAALFRDIASSIREVWLDALNALPGDFPPLPSAFIAGMEIILNMAYEWNRAVKMEIVKYDFEPFVFAPLSPYDPAKMEPFEHVHRSVQTGGKIVSSVSLGLVASIAFGGERVSHVQHKTGVLVEEWFLKKPVMQQPQQTPAMKMSVRNDAPTRVHQDPPPAAPKKGCCG